MIWISPWLRHCGKRSRSLTLRGRTQRCLTKRWCQPRRENMIRPRGDACVRKLSLKEGAALDNLLTATSLFLHGLLERPDNKQAPCGTLVAYETQDITTSSKKKGCRLIVRHRLCRCHVWNFQLWCVYVFSAESLISSAISPVKHVVWFLVSPFTHAVLRPSISLTHSIV